MRRAFPIPALLALSAVLASLGQSRSTAPYGYDLHGRPVDRLATPTAQAIVLFFVATDCPISNRYVPEMQRLEKEFAGRRVAFWVVYPNATETASGVLHHRAAYELEGSALLRPQPAVMALVRPTVTPESAVLVPGKGGRELRSLYVGRIDDRYVDIGRQRPQAGRHDLEEAIKAALAGAPVVPPGGPPVGCGIISDAALAGGAGKP